MQHAVKEMTWDRDAQETTFEPDDSGNALMKVVYWQKSNLYSVSSSYVLENAMHSVTSAFKHMSHFTCNMLHANVACHMSYITC